MDIVTELRQGIGLPTLIADAEELMDKAADEIERLRAALYEIMTEPLDDEGYGNAKRIARDALEQFEREGK